MFVSIVTHVNRGSVGVHVYKYICVHVYGRTHVKEGVCVWGVRTEIGNWEISAQRIRKVGGADYLEQEVSIVATGSELVNWTTCLQVMSILWRLKFYNCQGH